MQEWMSKMHPINFVCRQGDKKKIVDKNLTDMLKNYLTNDKKS